MADTKISALPAITPPLAEGDQLPVNDGGTTRMTTVAQVHDAVAESQIDLSGVAMDDDTYILQLRQFKLSGSSQLSLAGGAEIYISDFGANAETIVGSPRVGSWVVPDGYGYDLLGTMFLGGIQQATIRGTGLVIITDDFATRQTIVLAG